MSSDATSLTVIKCSDICFVKNLFLALSFTGLGPFGPPVRAAPSPRRPQKLRLQAVARKLPACQKGKLSLFLSFQLCGPSLLFLWFQRLLVFCRFSEVDLFIIQFISFLLE